MRPIYRYGYPIRRFIHHSWGDFRVWRQNREVAGAFRDPILEGPDLKSWATERLRQPVVLWAAGLSLAAGLGLAAKAGMDWMERADERAALADVPAAPAGSGPMGGDGKPATGEDKPVTIGGDSASQGVNMAIVLAMAGMEPGTEVEPQPAAPAALPERYNVLVACKRERTLYVYERKAKGEWSKLASFAMAFGRKEGDKADEGDRRTPEGRYWITSVLSGPSQGPLYGSLIFTLNYPTPRDLAEGKSGEGIWIHGVEAGKRPTFTRGCLSLANNEALELAKYADVGTPVLILADSLLADPARQLDETGMQREYPALMAEHARRNRADTLKLEKALAEARAFLRKEARDFPAAAAGGLSPEDKRAILDRLAKWREDWSNRDAEAYARNYAAGFRDREGRALETFLERKRRIFASKTKITMEMDTPAILPEGDGKANVTFRQDYAAEGGEGIQRSSGTKTVWLEHSPDGWLIVKE